jgi:hypothetical protein
MKWEKCVEALISILENPFLENGYKELKDYYESNNMKYESSCVEYLIINKFKNVDDPNFSKKQ